MDTAKTARILMPEDWETVTEIAATVKAMAEKICTIEKKLSWKENGKGEFMKKSEVCERLHISPSKLYVMTKNGLLKNYAFDGRKERLYRREEIEAYAQNIEY